MTEKWELTEGEIIDLVKDYHLSGVENWHVLARKVADAAASKCRRQLNLSEGERLAVVEKESKLIGVDFVTIEGAAIYFYAQERMIKAGFSHKILRFLEANND